MCEKVSGVKIGNGAVRGWQHGGAWCRAAERVEGGELGVLLWERIGGEGLTVCGDAGVWKLRGEGGKLSPCGVVVEELWKGCG